MFLLKSAGFFLELLISYTLIRQQHVFMHSCLMQAATSRSKGAAVQQWKRKRIGSAVSRSHERLGCRSRAFMGLRIKPWLLQPLCARLPCLPVTSQLHLCHRDAFMEPSAVDARAAVCSKTCAVHTGGLKWRKHCHFVGQIKHAYLYLTHDAFLCNLSAHLQTYLMFDRFDWMIIFQSWTFLRCENRIYLHIMCFSCTTPPSAGHTTIWQLLFGFHISFLMPNGV